MFLWNQEITRLFDEEKGKTENGVNLFFKALANRFWLTLKNRYGSAKLVVHGRPCIKQTSWKGNDMLPKVD